MVNVFYGVAAYVGVICNWHDEMRQLYGSILIPIGSQCVLLVTDAGDLTCNPYRIYIKRFGVPYRIYIDRIGVKSCKLFDEYIYTYMYIYDLWIVWASRLIRMIYIYIISVSDCAEKAMSDTQRQIEIEGERTKRERKKEKHRDTWQNRKATKETGRNTALIHTQYI